MKLGNMMGGGFVNMNKNDQTSKLKKSLLLIWIGIIGTGIAFLCSYLIFQSCVGGEGALAFGGLLFMIIAIPIYLISTIIILLGLITGIKRFLRGIDLTNIYKIFVCLSLLTGSLFIVCFFKLLFINFVEKEYNVGGIAVTSKYIITVIRGNPSIQFYDLSKKRWVKVIKIPSYLSQHFAVDDNRILRARGDDRLVFARDDNAYVNAGLAGIMRINQNGDIVHLTGQGTGYNIDGIDNENLYIELRSSTIPPDKKESVWVYQGYRINSKTSQIIKHHFEEYPDLLVQDNSGNEKETWYACLDGSGKNQENHMAADGHIFLVKKQYKNSPLEIFKLDDGKVWSKLKMAMDDKNIYLLAEEHTPKFTSYGMHVNYNKGSYFITFSKDSKSFSGPIYTGKKLAPFPNQIFNTNSRFVWAYINDLHSGGHNSMFLIDKKTGGLAHYENNTFSVSRLGSFGSSFDNVWISATKRTSNPYYIFRLSNDGAVISQIQISPTFIERAAMQGDNLLRFLLSPLQT
jgi:hypothetical protein